MSVEPKIRRIAETFASEGVNYYYHNWNAVNTAFSDGRCDLPAIVYILPASGSMDFSKASIKDAPEAMIAFLDKSELDFDAEQNEYPVDRMKRLALRFFTRLMASGEFMALPEVMQYRTVYGATDEILTGVTFEVTLKETKGACLNGSQC